MTNELTWWQVLGSLGSFLSGIGLIAAAVSLLYLARQTKANERAALASVYQSIVALGDSINMMFINHPDLFKILFDETSEAGAIDVRKDESMNPRRFYAASKWLDYFELVLVLWPSIPVELRSPWRAYIKDHLAKSGYLRALVLGTNWYGDDLRQLASEAWNSRPTN